MRPYDLSAADQESTRDRLLRAGSELFARHGFRGVGIRDIAAGADVSAAAIYKHFRNKQEILAALLVGISEYLLDNALRLQVKNGGTPPEAQVGHLITFHVGFALGYRDLIQIQYRDLDSLEEAPRRRVRELQRRYVEVWADVLGVIDPQLPDSCRRARAQACFGLINSAAHQPEGTRGLDRILTEMAEASLGVGAAQARSWSPKTTATGSPKPATTRA